MKRFLSLALCASVLFLSTSAVFAKGIKKAKQPKPLKVEKTLTAEEYYRLGADYEWKNNRLGAAEVYSKALELNPDYNDARIARAKIYYFYEKYDKALEDYNYFYQKPNYGAASFFENRINCKKALGMYEEAMDDMFEVILAYGGQAKVYDEMKAFAMEHPELQYKLNPDNHKDLLIKYSTKAPELRGYAKTYESDE